MDTASQAPIPAPATAAQTQPQSFPDHERRLLLSTPGISHGVVSRIEQEGYCSLHELLDHGIDRVVEQICRVEGNFAWRNRRRALGRALSRLEAVDTD